MPTDTPKQSLKEGNSQLLLVSVLANTIILLILILDSTLLSSLSRIMVRLAGAGVGLVVIAALTSMLTADAKAMIVFFRRKDPLPGSRAFTVYLHSDTRIDATALEERYGPFPIQPTEQNALWYRVYRRLEDDPAVSAAHKQFLLLRDYACLSLLMILAFVPIALWYLGWSATVLAYGAALALQFGVALRGARVNARRLVTTVLARASADA